MSKKKSKRVIKIGEGDLDVGGILKNGKAGDELRKQVVAKLKKFVVETEPKKITMYDALLKSGAIVEDEVSVEPEPVENPPVN